MIYHRKFLALICKWLNLRCFILQEITLSCLSKGIKNFYKKWKEIPERELAYLLQNYNLNTIKKIIVVGAGAIPYTAIFFAKHIDKLVYAIEKDRLAYFCCLNLIRRLNINNIKVINDFGQHYPDYKDSLVIISLHTISKRAVFEHILNTNNIVVIRQPLQKDIHLYEDFSLDGLKYTTIIHPHHNFKSIVLSDFLA